MPSGEDVVVTGSGDRPIPGVVSQTSSRDAPSLRLDSDSAASLVVRPDGIVHFPVNGDWDSVCFLSRWLRPLKFEDVMSFQIDREYIVARTMDPGEIEKFVNNLIALYGDRELPQTIRVTLSELVQRVGKVKLGGGQPFLYVEDEEMVQVLCASTRLSQKIVRVIDNHLILFDSRVDRKRILADLRNLGVYAEYL